MANSPTAKQRAYAWSLFKKSKLPMPDRCMTDQAICGGYISAAKAKLGIADKPMKWSDEAKDSGYTDHHIERIKSGGPLKNDPSPYWD